MKYLHSLSALLVLVSILLGSCHKTDRSDAARFAGRYNSNCIYGGRYFDSLKYSDVIDIKTNGSNSILVPVLVGDPGDISYCTKQVTVAVSVSGNNILPSHSIANDGCGLLYNLVFSGEVSGNTITLNCTETYPAAQDTIIFSFSGVK